MEVPEAALEFPSASSPPSSASSSAGSPSTPAARSVTVSGAPSTLTARQHSADVLPSPMPRVPATPTTLSAAAAERQHGHSAVRAQRILRSIGRSKGSPSSDSPPSPLPPRVAPTEPGAAGGGLHEGRQLLQERVVRGPELPAPPPERAAWDEQASRGNADLIEGNSRAIDVISGEVRDLGEVFAELAQLVQSQATPLQLIEGQVERAALATGAAAREMEKAADNQAGCLVS